MFCKFRGFDLYANSNRVNFNGKNSKRIKEILEKEVLYAAEFYKFNDILDCAFAVDDSIKSENESNKENKSNKEILGIIYNEKTKKYICSVSRCYNENCNEDRIKEHLMWAHYANNHYGVRIDFELNTNKKPEAEYFMDDVTYIDGFKCLNIHKYDSSDINTILVHKHKIWEYENEYRIIVDKEKYRKIPIIIKRVVIGRGFYKNKTLETNDGKNIICSIAKQLKSFLKDKSVKIYYYESRYSDKIIELL
ncbi:MAG: DUF2971 domain-containing protein [Campylobacter sp.]|uniref:DUF2971 domain-containing protein n=1 Tax=Campylobacter sp. TaxID=205 RepID=UPI002A8834EB|nr:DUF2971 domain-containing protein [Campylobacter sp.]MCI6343759.1 DUF2971 domain-containing protein [Campylobacter sp.]MCI7463658.1 DUF2971 domain-containing protein [Campylobacter sp.]MDY4859729.1 DUF2971 domain-containing protein [Campylobacter sp.]